MTHIDLARLCRDSYSSDGIDAAVEVGGLANRCFVLADRQPAVVVFRGTANAAGWLQDVRATRVTPPGPMPIGTVHKGFLECWEDLRRRVAAIVQSRPVILTGHSLGGALATLAALSLGHVQEVVTFGAPRVGDAEFVAAYQPRVLRTTRYVHESDPVPWIPGYLAGYRHVCPATLYDGATWGPFGLWPWLKITWRQVWTEREMVWCDHDIERYMAALAAAEL